MDSTWFSRYFPFYVHHSFAHRWLPLHSSRPMVHTMANGFHTTIDRFIVIAGALYAPGWAAQNSDYDFMSCLVTRQ